RFKAFLWELILAHILVDRGDRFSKKEFLRRLLKRISSHYNVNHADLLASLITRTKESGIPTTFKEEMLHSLAQISHGEGEKDADRPPPPRASRTQPPDLDMLRAIMTAATISASEAEIATYWRTISTKWPGETRDFLYKSGKRKKARQNLVERFGDSRIMLVIIHLEPENRDFIENVSDNAEAMQKAARAAEEPPPRFKAFLWELILAHILVDRGSRFNKREFIRSLLRGMASHYNLEYTELLHSLRRVISGTAMDGLRKIELLDILFEISEKPETEPDSDAGEILAAATLSDAIYRFLTDGFIIVDNSVITESARVQRMIQQLARTNPEELKRLFSRLENSPARKRQEIGDKKEPARPHRIPADLFRLLARGETDDESRAQINELLKTLAAAHPEKLRELVFHAALDPTLFQNLLTAAPPGLLLKALASGQGARANIRHARRMDRIIAFIQSFARD
ncbi:MAG: hypothetical protein GY859_41850, partial [Desulfobacterales bacterium]|nr:hypothetical protein [Desulfobacterales bacterium]